MVPIVRRLKPAEKWQVYLIGNCHGVTVGQIARSFLNEKGHTAFCDSCLRSPVARGDVHSRHAIQALCQEAFLGFFQSLVKKL